MEGLEPPGRRLWRSLLFQLSYIRWTEKGPLRGEYFAGSGPCSGLLESRPQGRLRILACRSCDINNQVRRSCDIGRRVPERNCQAPARERSPWSWVLVIAFAFRGSDYRSITFWITLTPKDAMRNPFIPHRRVVGVPAVCKSVEDVPDAR